MKKFLPLLLLCGLLGSCKNDAAKKSENANITNAVNDFKIIPGSRVGLITANTTEAQLEQLYGAENLKMQRIVVAEGEEQAGVILFPDTDKEIEIIWQMASSEGKPAFIRISKDSTVWKTEEGITIGSSLEALEKANGKPFEFYGFEWDYGGLVTNWNGGNFNSNIIVALVPQRFNVLKENMLGEIPLSSADPEIRALNARVGSIVITFD